MEIAVWVLFAVTLLLLLAGLVMQFLERSAAREERVEARLWRTNFGNRFIDLEKAVLNRNRPSAPQLQPAFTGRDSAEPTYGSPPGSSAPAPRQGWAPTPPSSKKKR